MHPRLREAIEHEFAQARRLAGGGDRQGSFRHLERAHVLGQKVTAVHVRAHWAMLRSGWQARDAREVAGQVMRLIGAALFTWLWVPEGNTGGANIGAFARLPIPDELRRLIDS